MRIPRPSKPHASTIARIALVTLTLLCLVGLASGLFISHELSPIDGRLGLPQRLDFPLCGIRYHVSTGGHENRAEVEAAIDPRFGAPYILHPTVGQIPLVDLITQCPTYPMPDGTGRVRSTVVWLQIGQDEYVAFGLDGGP